MEQETEVRHGPGTGSTRASDALHDDRSRRSVWEEERLAHDRWAWRRAIRAHPRKYRVYRVVVGLVGALLVLLGASTGWLPGPGGIPLVLLGLAVLASEFEWAHRLLGWARRKAEAFAHWARTLPWWFRGLGFLLTAAGLVLAGWLALTIFGLPDWMPGQASALLGGLPGIP